MKPFMPLFLTACLLTFPLLCLSFDCKQSDQYTEHQKTLAADDARLFAMQDQMIAFLMEKKGLGYDSAVNELARSNRSPDELQLNQEVKALLEKAIKFNPQSTTECLEYFELNKKASRLLLRIGQLRLQRIKNEKSSAEQEWRSRFDELCLSWTDPPQSTTERTCSCMYEKVAVSKSLSPMEAILIPKPFWEKIPSSVPTNTPESVLKSIFNACAGVIKQ